MNLAKFLSLLAGRSLWFANAEVLAAEDPYEAMLPKPNYAHRVWKTEADVAQPDLNALRAKLPIEIAIQTKIEREAKVRDEQIRQTFALRKSFHLNCWNAAAHESSAMWRLYSNEGIAIVSSMERLTNALAKANRKIYCGHVDYLDYETEGFETGNVFNPLLRKRKSFDFENEVRLVWWDTDVTHKHAMVNGNEVWTNRPIDELEDMPIRAGVNVDCDLDVLIDEIVLSPTTQEWLAEAVAKLAQSFGLRISVRRSNLLDAPTR